MKAPTVGFRILLSLLGLVLAAAVTAQPNMIVEHYTKEEGLPSNTVYCALKDSDGFVWFGTWHGLCSFDGTKFTPYTTRSSHLSDVPPQKVRNLVEDKDGYLWIRNTDNHLYVFDRKTEAYNEIYDELKQKSRNVQVIKIQRMDNGNMLILTRNKDMFVAKACGDNKVSVEKIYASESNIDPSTMRLKHNVLGESNGYVYWLSTNLRMSVVTKPSRRRLLAGLPAGSRVTCFRRTGRYICVGTADGHISVIDINSGSTVKQIACLRQSPVSSINIINSRMYFTLPDGLYTVAGNGSQRRLTTLGGNTVRSFIDRYSKLWLCPAAGPMVCYDPATAKTQTFTMPQDSLFAEMKFIDAGANGLFILQRNGEVWRFDHDTRSMHNVNSLRDFRSDAVRPHFFDIDIDDNGILWLSSTTDGVYKVCFPKYNFRFLFPDLLDIKNTGYDDTGVRAVFKSRNGDLWVGTRDGNLFCIDLRQHRLKRKFNKDDVGTVYHIMEDKAGNLWFSTKGAGLIKASPDALSPSGMRLTKYTNIRGDRNSLSSNRVYYTYQDSKGRIWVCTFYGGLNLMEKSGGRVVFRHKKNGLKTYPQYELFNDVRMITEDGNGRLWVATTDGLMSFDGNFKRPSDIQFETYRGQNNPGVTSNDISIIYKDSKGRIWMGIFGNGLNLLEYYDEHNRRPVLKPFAINERRSGNVITSITEDKNHCLWIGTENGLGSLNEGSSFVKVYDRFAGFPDVTLEDNTALCLPDGNILIGSRQGLLTFNPDDVKNSNVKAYKTFIVDFKVTNHDLEDFDPPIYQGSVKYARKIVLKHNQATFTIEFASPYYADNNPMPYAYILDGYEEQWHYNGNNRIASYANVPPGHYKFRVKVDDYNSPESVLDVIILPPWWATWWAYLIYAVLTVLALYAILRTVMYIIRMRNEVYINERLAELKIRFFTNVSHELRTPLTLIQGPAQELKKNEKLSTAGKEYLDLIERNSAKMLHLVNQILDLRKIQNGKMKLHVSLADMGGIIESVMSEFRVMANERNITFSLKKPDKKVMAWCDTGKIGVVIGNLINNAFKYTDNGGNIKITLSLSNDTVKIIVEDDGASIPESQLEQIFERFTQADNKTSGTGQHTGTGIGLSLAKEYVNMHDGRIWAGNRLEGDGAVFNIELPAGKEHFKAHDTETYFDDGTAEDRMQTVSDAESHTDNSTGNDPESEKTLPDNIPTVMLAEDNADLCRMLQLQLGTRYNVITAHDGAEGLKKTYQHHPDIIVTDLMMPCMDGLELLRNVRRDFSISHTPVIILTAKNTDEDKMTAVKAGANAFITKPFSSDYLVARIEQLLNEQRVFQRKMAVRTTALDANGTKDEYGQHLIKQDIDFVQKIHEIIENNLNADDFNIDTIAETIGLSRSAFFKKLKSLTGFAPVDLVKEIRLNKAARLIKTTDGSISEIAYSVGFSDSGYFGKCFRKKYGMTPKEYRKAERQKNELRQAEDGESQ